MGAGSAAVQVYLNVSQMVTLQLSACHSAVPSVVGSQLRHYGAGFLGACSCCAVPAVMGSYPQQRLTWGEAPLSAFAALTCLKVDRHKCG